MKEKTRLILQNIKERVSRVSALSLLYDTCKLAGSELNAPMRIAITGEIKTGKSTLLNAFMGSEIVPTAVEVMTYNINWFHHVSCSPNGKECFVVHYLDGTIDTNPLEEIASFVGYSEDKTELINSIDWVDAYVNQPLLEKFDLIDTPGLGSLLGNDSKHTKDLLTTNTNRPDAIIYLVNQEFKDTDINAIEEFHATTNLMSGISAIAAFTRVDEMNGLHNDASANIGRAKTENSNIRYNFAEIYSIAALPAVASWKLNDEEIDALCELKKIPNLPTLLANKQSFQNSDWKSNKLRNSLLDKLTIKGIKLVVNYFLNNPSATNEDCRKYLYDFSRVKELEQVIITRFGERADFHKSNRVLAMLRKACNTLSKNKQLVGTDKQILKQVLDLIKQSEIELHKTYADYYLLSDYYNQETYIEEEEWERVKRLLGECGKSIHDRLDLPLNATDDEIKDAHLQEMKYWQNKHNKAKILGNPTIQKHTETILNVLQNQLNL